MSLAALGVAAVAGCAGTEPYRRADAWTATGSNAANLASMVAEPADLAMGRDMAGADGQEAAASVDRLRTDHRKPLDSGSTTGLGGAGASGGGGGGASASGAASN